jgi:hypothetical protein
MCFRKSRSENPTLYLYHICGRRYNFEKRKFTVSDAQQGGCEPHEFVARARNIGKATEAQGSKRERSERAASQVSACDRPNMRLRAARRVCVSKPGRMCRLITAVTIASTATDMPSYHRPAPEPVETVVPTGVPPKQQPLPATKCSRLQSDTRVDRRGRGRQGSDQSGAAPVGTIDRWRGASPGDGATGTDQVHHTVAARSFSIGRRRDNR